MTEPCCPLTKKCRGYFPSMSDAEGRDNCSVTHREAIVLKTLTETKVPTTLSSLESSTTDLGKHSQCFSQ